MAGDDDSARTVGIDLVGDSGFDGLDAGPLSDSWRQQPGAPFNYTDLTSDQMPQALAQADRQRLPRRRDILVAAAAERFGDGSNPSAGMRRADQPRTAPVSKSPF